MQHTPAMKRRLPLSALGIAAVIALAGCGGAAESPSGTTAPPAGSQASAGHNDADVMFAQMMIPHHQQAVEMSDMILAKDGVNPDVTELADRIKDAQAPEIETMTGWLEAWGEPIEADAGHHMESADGMDGMLTEDQMAQLETAEGEEASGIFLESMIAHHEGAVEMAQEEIRNGENPDAVALAEDIVAAQEAEMKEMEELLAGL